MNRRDALPAGILTLCLLALLLPIARIGVDPHHDGAMLKPALDVFSGQVLFRDSFMQYGALACYLHVLALWIQPTLLSLRLMTVAAYAASLVSVYAVARIILPRSLAAVTGVFFILFIPVYEKDYWNHEDWLLLPWSSAFALMFQCLGLYAFCRVIRSQQPERWGLVAGMACACVFWCRQPVGITMLGSLLVTWPALLWTGWRPAASSSRAIFGRIAGGFLLVNGLLFGGIWLMGALPAWWYQNIVWPARWSQAMVWMDTLRLSARPEAAAGILVLGLAPAVPGIVRRLRPDWPSRFSQAYFAVLGAVLVWQHTWLCRILAVGEGGWNILIPLGVGLLAAGSIRQAFAARGKPQTDEFYLVAAMAALALASLTQYYPMADSWHIFYSLAPVFGLFVFAVWRWSGWPASRVTFLLAAMLLPSAYLKIQAIGPAVNRPLVTLTKPALLRGMRVPAEQARSFGLIADTLDLVMRYQPDIPSAMIGNNALYLCFTRNQANPTPYYVTWRGLASQTDNVQRWDYILHHRPLMILQEARWDAVNDFYRTNNYVPLIYVPAESLEIAVPQELAATMGLKAYGADPGAAQARATGNP